MRIFGKTIIEACLDLQELTPTDNEYKCGIGENEFYFDDLQPEQVTEFVGLFENEGLNLAPPGYFPTSPWLPGFGPLVN